jgi:hypothetical protein
MSIAAAKSVEMKVCIRASFPLAFRYQLGRGPTLGPSNAWVAPRSRAIANGEARRVARRWISTPALARCSCRVEVGRPWQKIRGNGLRSPLLQRRPTKAPAGTMACATAATRVATIRAVGARGDGNASVGRPRQARAEARLATTRALASSIKPLASISPAIAAAK